MESTVEGTSSLVTRKLSSALVVFCLHFPEHGHRCLRHLLCSLYLRRHAGADEVAAFWEAHPVFEPRVLETAVAFATDLVDEAGKVDVNSERQYVVSDRRHLRPPHSHQESLGIYQCIRDSVHDAVALLSAGLNPASRNTQPELSLKQSSVKCLLVCPTRHPRCLCVLPPQHLSKQLCSNLRSVSSRHGFPSPTGCSHEAIRFWIPSGIYCQLHWILPRTRAIFSRQRWNFSQSSCLVTMEF